MSKRELDIRTVAVNYRDELIDELARLDAFIDWAESLARTGRLDSDGNVADLYVLTGAERPQFLH